MRKLRPNEKYTCEAELCQQFCDVARKYGFKVYAETADFDLLLVAGPDCKGFREGDQIGVEAKLIDSVEVLHQALPRNLIYNQSPHYYAVLVPGATPEFRELARRLKISVIEGLKLKSNDSYRSRDTLYGIHWHRIEPNKLCWVPELEVHELPAGVKGPVKITEWKLAAIKLCMVGVKRGYLTSADFKTHGIAMSRWVAKGWIAGTELIVHEGKRMKRYVLVDEKKPPHLLYGVVTAAMEKAGLL